MLPQGDVQLTTSLLVSVTEKVGKFKMIGVFQGLEKEWGEWEVEEAP